MSKPAPRERPTAVLTVAHDLAPPYGLRPPGPAAPLLRLPYEDLLSPGACPLLRGRLVRRRDRFLADIVLDRAEHSGAPSIGGAPAVEIVAHCVNTGRMEGLTRPGLTVYVSRAPAGRRLAFTWELTEVDGVVIGTNTALPNRLVHELLRRRLLPPFADHLDLAPERRFGERSRVDFWLRRPSGEHYLEVKNCHLVYPDRRGYFPDSISERATHHLHELSAMVAAGHHASVLFVVQRADATCLRPSDVHDPAFATAARAAAAAGVTFHALRVEPRPDALVLWDLVPVDLAPYDLGAPAAWRDRLRAESPAWERGPRAPKPAATKTRPAARKKPAAKKPAVTKSKAARKEPAAKAARARTPAKTAAKVPRPRAPRGGGPRSASGA